MPFKPEVQGCLVEVAGHLLSQNQISGSKAQHFLLIQVKTGFKHSITTAAARWDLTE